MNTSSATDAGPFPSRRRIIAADLHCDGSSRRVEMLENLLKSCQEEGADCWLLGDLFDVWLGPGQLALDMTRRELEALRRATDSNVDVVVIPGNRDFLLDSAFEHQTGVHVAGDHLQLETGGQRWHLSHGDLFSTGDIGYLRLRRILRSSWFRWLVRHMPVFVSGFLARILRTGSRRAIDRKEPGLMQPDREAVKELIDSGYDRVVCGHFHRAQEERIDGDKEVGNFTVLEAFEDRGAHLFVQDGKVEMRYVESS